MSKVQESPAIRLRGVRHNNLKNFDLDLPLGKLVVITGLSGSGKSSLAFDTLYAEGQRRYIETFSPYARQFFDRMDKPRVDRIEGIPPAIALEQRNSVKTTRSTVGTMTEIADYMKLLWPHIAQLHCRGCGKAVRKDSPQQVWAEMTKLNAEREVLVTFEVPLSDKLSLQESLGLISKQGFQRVLLDHLGRPEPVRLEEALEKLQGNVPVSFCIIQDRVRLEASNRSRFVEGCEQAFHFGKGLLTLFLLPDFTPCRYSNRLHCAPCDIDYKEPSPALFSFNNPVGACPSCKGFGRIIAIDYHLAIPDKSLPLAKGAIRPWQTGHGLDSQRDLMKYCKGQGIPTNIPFENLSQRDQNLVIFGDPDYGTDDEHQWPAAWYGIMGYFKWLETKAYKMHVRVQLAKYRCYITCPDCQGNRFKPDALLYQAPIDHARIHLAEFYKLPIRDALKFISKSQKPGAKKNDPFFLALEEVSSRLGYLDEVGLSYLTLDRATRSLSGGETERVNLTTCLGSRLVNTLFVLDEPSVGLHARDTSRLVKILERLRDNGNTIVVVEHESSVMRAADQIIDIGPGQGEKGGNILFQGPLSRLLKSTKSLTGSYLSGRKQVDTRTPRQVNLPNGPNLQITHATLHNLNDFCVDIPLSRFVVITGVSGSGKSTLVRDLLYPALASKLAAAPGVGENEESDLDEACTSVGRCKVFGWEAIGQALMVDQSAIGRTPRSNPAVYIGAFEHLRELFSESPVAAQRGLDSSSFSFNSPQGQCERCHGAGFEKIEMQFLSDVFIRCPECQGRRYRSHILEVEIGTSPEKQWSIADLLEATVDDAVEFLEKFSSRCSKHAISKLTLLQKVGLGYLRLGQPINTLSGGESQRLKLVAHLAEFASRRKDLKPSLFIFDEPTTGLHFDDVRVLLLALHELVDAGHSVIVVEHNLDVVRSADWIIDLGPEAGDLGGKLVAQGPPEIIKSISESQTGAALRSDR